MGKKLFRSLSRTTKLKFMTQILRFPESIPKEKKLQNVSTSKSFKMMMTQGYIKPHTPGIFSLMPLALRSYEKMCLLIDEVMETVHAQKVLFPTLVQDSLLKTTGRWDNNSNLFKLKDRHLISYCLGATHEEIATHLLSKWCASYKILPIRLYQISTKFRDEMNPKLGFLRGREFVMKDMYTFDSSIENAQLTYNAVCESYFKLFQLLGVDVIKVRGSSGDIGGESSHEFHILSDVGEDEVLYCSKCKNGINSELLGRENPVCKNCNTSYEKSNAIEVGHAFLLGTTYSKPLKAFFDNPDHEHELLQMGCYGLGVTRIIAACMEHLSTDNNNIRLPLLLAPFLLSVIIPKKGSKEEPVLPFAESLSSSLNKIDWLTSDVIVDDRTNLTIGKRVQEASAIGIPYIIVVGSSAMEEIPKIEVIDVYNSQTYFLTHKETLEFFRWKILPAIDV